MDEVENSVYEEVAPPETQIQEEMPAQESKVDERQERNWREMRRRQAELEKELKLQREMNERLLQMTTQAAPKVQEVDELDAIDDEEIISKGKVKKLVQKQAASIAKEIAQQEAEKLFKQRDQSQFMDKLRKQYADFDEVVNPETLAILEEQDPELAETIVELKDPYKIGVQSYKYIKALNLKSAAPQARRAKEVEKKLEANAKTVQSPQAYDKRPMAQAFKMTEAEKTKLYEEMYHYASQAGFSY